MRSSGAGTEKRPNLTFAKLPDRQNSVNIKFAKITILMGIEYHPRKAPRPRRNCMKTIRIGNGCGFWGDSVDAPIRLAQRGRLDYLTLEYLAELTMSILGLQKERDPDKGYAGDFLDVLDRLMPILQQQPGLKIITNAGGMNPASCGRRAKEIVQKAGLTRRIAIVSGDDLLPRLDTLLTQHSLTN